MKKIVHSEWQRKWMVGLLIGFSYSEVHPRVYELNQEDYSVIGELQSTDPDFPNTITEGITYLESYLSDEYFYYKTATFVTAGIYHIFCLNQVVPAALFRLFIYKNAAYSTYVTHTLWSDINWVIVRPDSDWVLYPKVYSASSNSAYLRWMAVNATLPKGENGSGYLDTAHYLDAYKIALTKGALYNFSLDVPATGDFDLLIYCLPWGGASTGLPALLWLGTVAQGVDEARLNWYCTDTGDGVLVVPCINGSGNYNLSYTELKEGGDPAPIPEAVLYTLIGAGLVILVGSILFVQFRNRRAERTQKESSKKKSSPKRAPSKGVVNRSQGEIF